MFLRRETPTLGLPPSQLLAMFALSLYCICPAQSAAAQKDDNGAPEAPQPATIQNYNYFAVIAPSLSWTTGTQTQTIAGGSFILSALHSQSYCDSHTHQYGIAGNASDTSTSKAGAPAVNLDNNEVKVDGTFGVFGRTDPNSKTQITNIYVGADADFFGNNSLGVGLQQTYAIESQFYLRGCRDKAAGVAHTAFASFGVGAGFMRQRLYSTQNKPNFAVLPISGQFSYLLGETPENRRS